MKKDIIEKIGIEGIDVSLVRKPGPIYNVKISDKGKELERGFKTGKNILIEKQENFLIIKAKNGTKKEKRIIMSVAKHIKNMIKGLKEPWIYKLEICYGHFPISVSIDDKTKQLVIKNFFGERVPRFAKLLKNVDVQVKGNVIEVSSPDKELAGKQAALIENSTRVTKKDRRIFQDGIWIIEKAGRHV